MQVQGKTLDYFILSIGPRPNIRPVLTLTDLHVLISRVRLGKRLFVIGFNPKEQNQHLKQLKPSTALAVWEAGYDEHGRWDAQRAAAFATQLAAEQSKAVVVGRASSRTPNSSRAKRAATVSVSEESKRPKVAHAAKRGRPATAAPKGAKRSKTANNS